MQSVELVTQTDLTRQERLKVWLWRNNLPQAAIARKLGVAKATVGYWIRAEHLPTERVAMLRELGIPAELLPEARDLPSGPRPVGALLFD